MLNSILPTLSQTAERLGLARFTLRRREALRSDPGLHHFLDCFARRLARKDGQ